MEILVVGEDELRVRRRRSPGAALLPVLAATAWVALIFALELSTMWGLIALGLGLGALPWLTRHLLRAVRTKEVALRCTGVAVLLDGEPLEAARVETRVIGGWLRSTPKGYSLSLWALLTAGGNRDLELGRFPTLLAASSAAGEIEAFLGRASIKSKPASTLR